MLKSNFRYLIVSTFAHTLFGNVVTLWHLLNKKTNCYESIQESKSVE